MVDLLEFLKEKLSGGESVESIDENIFDTVRRSPAYEYARCHEYLSYEISLDET